MIIQMYTYIVLFISLTFSIVAVNDFLQKVLSVAICIADIHQELPIKCVFIMKTDGEQQSENYIYIYFFLAGIML
jgi:hypothetical protein